MDDSFKIVRVVRDVEAEVVEEVVHDVEVVYEEVVTLGRLALNDTREFSRDFVSSSVRIFVTFTVLRRVGIGFEGSASTSVLLCGAKLFTAETNWYQRTRSHVFRGLRNKVRRPS